MMVSMGGWLSTHSSLAQADGAMTRRSSAALLIVPALILGTLLRAGFSADQSASASLKTSIQEHLAAGEFAPAVRLAHQAPTPQQRDAWLAEIATAQAQAGAANASLASTSEISDDRVRAEALSQIASYPPGGQGGGAMADFDSLIELITTTIAPTTWDEVGGPGSIAPFPTGVYVDAAGVLQPLLQKDADGKLGALRDASAPARSAGSARQPSPLRKISLPRLEKWLQLRRAAGREPTEAMQFLAGLERIQYVFVYPESGDLVLAGPAGDWKVDAENRVVSTQTGHPVVRLDDLAVVLRHMMSGRDARFGCAITPTQDSLARVQAFLAQSQKKPLKPGQRGQWLSELRGCLGKQEIDVYGLDPRTRAARILVEADYRMKLVGMGLEEGVPEVESYLQMLEIPPGGSPPPMDVLRWWFTLHYDAVLAAADRNAFALRGQGVKVLSENELLTQEGKRIHTGDSDELNRRFARSFTEHFDALCHRYPIYAELRNLFDLALVGALVREEDLAGKATWHMTYFGDPEAYQVELAASPEQVETVINHRVINQVHIVAGVSGGVRVDPSPLVAREAIELDYDGRLDAQRRDVAAQTLPPEAWWWD